jgi:hypothetical protein
LQERLAQLLFEKGEEEALRARNARENERRRHNYTPFIMECLQVLADSGRLQELLGKVDLKRA